MQIKAILFPTDFSEASMYALPHAVDMAKLFSAKLYMLHVVQDISMMSELSLPHASFDQIHAEIEAAAEAELKKFGSQKRADLKDVEYAVMRGIPYEEILRFAEKNAVDLIVISSHGKTGIDRVLFGSTVQRVVRRARCLVLTVRAGKP